MAEPGRPRPAHSPPPRSGFRRALLAAIPVLALLILAGVIVSSGTSGSSAGAASPANTSGATTVTRRDLVSTDTESGTLGYGDPRTVFGRLAGTITSLPQPGQVIRPGGTLYTVDNNPVVLMDGTVPAYRTLSEGVARGPDVLELKRNLHALGFDTAQAMTVDDTFDRATTAAVERWQASLGEPETGTVTLGQVVFLPGARRISSVSASVGSSGGAASATTASVSVPPHPEFVSLTQPVAATSTTTVTSTRTVTRAGSGPRSIAGRPRSATRKPNASAALLALLRAETAELRAELRTARAGATTAGGRSASAAAAVTSGASRGGGSAAATGGASGGSTSGGGQPVMQTTSTALVATVGLDATKQSEAVLGAPVTVQMPDGRTVKGRISQVAAAAQSTSSSAAGGSSSGGGGSSSSSGGSGSGSPSAVVPVTITLSGHRRTAGLDQAAVSVNFQQQKAAGVLAVPVTALLATAGGGYAVQEAAPPHHLLPVTTGLFAAGYVQISGPGIRSGLQVTDSQG